MCQWWGKEEAAIMTTKPAQCRQVHRNVLIIDDNEDLALSLSCLLQFHGCNVDVAFDGPEGIRLASEHHFDVIFVDIGLPSMSGYEVALAIRSVDLEAPLLLAQTAYSQPADIRRSFEAGFDGHLVKPVAPAEIVRHVVEGRSALAKKTKGSGGDSTTDLSSSQKGFLFGSINTRKYETREPWLRELSRD